MTPDKVRDREEIAEQVKALPFLSEASKSVKSSFIPVISPSPVISIENGISAFTLLVPLSEFLKTTSALISPVTVTPL